MVLCLLDALLMIGHHVAAVNLRRESRTRHDGQVSSSKVAS